jgi:hypothetical protein
VQTEAFDYPAEFFERRVWHIGRPLPDAAALERAAKLIRSSQRPLIIAGGGVIYSDATSVLQRLVTRTGIPVGETQAGKGSQTWSAAALYDNKFGDFRLQWSAGISGSKQEGSGVGDTTNRENFGAWDSGINVGWGPVTVGGSFEHVQNARSVNLQSNQNNNTFDLGALYTIGPFSTSVGWSKGYYRGFAAAGSATAILNVYALVFDYVLGPGVSLGAAFEFQDYKSGVPSSAAINGDKTQNNHTGTIELGTAFTF